MIRYWLVISLFALSHLFSESPVIIGICGGTCSGKTTLAERLCQAFSTDCVLISQDSYYKDLSNLNLEERSQTNFDHPNSIDFKLLRKHILALKNNEPIYQPIYDFQTHSRAAEKREKTPAKLILVEGILIFAIEELRDLFDLKLFIDADHDVRMLRRIERDLKERGRDFSSVKNQYLKTVKPMHEAFVEPSKIYADVIIPRGGYNPKALSFIQCKLNYELNTGSLEIESPICLEN